MLKNPYTRIAVASALATLIAPRIASAVFNNTATTVSPDGTAVVVTLATPNLMTIGIAGATTAFLYVLLGMAAS